MVPISKHVKRISKGKMGPNKTKDLPKKLEGITNQDKDISHLKPRNNPEAGEFTDRDREGDQRRTWHKNEIWSTMNKWTNGAKEGIHKERDICTTKKTRDWNTT